MLWRFFLILLIQRILQCLAQIERLCRRNYRNEHGQLLEHAPYSERDIRRPKQLVPQNEKGEYRLLVKTTAARYDAVEAAIRALHPYELPAIYAVPTERAFAPYAAWVQEGSGG